MKCVGVSYWQPVIENPRNDVISVRRGESSNKLENGVFIFWMDVTIDLHHKGVSCQPVKSTQS